MINDNELIQIFIEEAQEILENINNKFEEWRLNPKLKDCLNPILRELHTLKGSARMVGLVNLNEFTHSLEQIIQNINNNTQPSTPNLIDDIEHSLDDIHFYIDELEKSGMPDDNILSHKFTKSSEEPKKTEPIVQEESKAHPLQTPDSIRIKTDLLESFGDLVEQINIVRAHGEQHLKVSYEALLEMTKQIKDICEMIRQVQVKTDSNLRMYQTVGEKKYEEFDILEMDRYSFLQQSTRLMTERASQLNDLNAFVLTSIRNVESLFVEQKRSVKRLEEKIRHTRLISIDHLVPRLKRVVRQVSNELSKEVYLKCLRVEGEIDRKVLDKLIGPIEHMIRNAIDHGIELPLVREKIGKPKFGCIFLSLFQQGNEIIIQLADDGQGINVDKIRQKAIEKGLLSSNTISKEQALQMIFLPGFSTKETITPISGQGVGMDVVNTEVKKLGGVLRIESKKNVGTEFTIKLPFTLSLNSALVFTIAEQTYALPLSHLAGLARFSVAKLCAKAKSKNYTIQYAGKKYSFFFLIELLEEGKWDSINLPSTVPVIFLNFEHQSIAIVVDKLIGSSEILIKPTGSQLQFVREISGVSILGDGQIVLILDAPSLLTRAFTLTQEIFPQPVAVKKKKIAKLKVLIVDDSVTVRQVTSRFLKRNGFEVITAKDGLEALEAMAHNLPNIVLLDIEMPKMDGFEVIENMRAQDRYKNIPIIMITSRSGDKHRQRALQMGANGYLTKPYIDDDLLALVRKIQFEMKENS